MTDPVSRRAFNKGLAATAAATGLGAGASLAEAAYRGPNVVIVRFGGGVRRRETIGGRNSYSPYLLHELTKRGVLFPNMRIADLKGIVTSHGEGTLNILTGKYEAYKDVSGRLFRESFEASVPTLFEYVRKKFNVPPHRTLLVNGEDRTDEEFYTFGNHHLFGVNYRAETLSLYRFKTWVLRQKIAGGEMEDNQRQEMIKELAKLESFDYRRVDQTGQHPQIEEFWARWRQRYGENGFKNPRGDRLLTELALRALKELRPRLIMINYQDPDYVHWGNASHYTRAISVIDQDLQRLVAFTDTDAYYRGRTVYVILPDCGRDSNALMRVPFQHHFNSKSAHEIWALVFGPGIARGVRVDRPVDQLSIAPTVGALMGFKTRFADGRVLDEVFA